MNKKRGRPAKPHNHITQALERSNRDTESDVPVSLEPEGQRKHARTDDMEPSRMGVALNPTESSLTEDNGTRFVPELQEGRGREASTGRGRGRKSTNRVVNEKQQTRVRNTKQYRWSAVGRDAFDNAQRQGNRTDEHPNYGQRYERGEGGGVT